MSQKKILKPDGKPVEDEAVSQLSRLDKKTKREKFDYNKTNIKDKDDDIMIKKDDIEQAVKDMAKERAFGIDYIDIFENDELKGEFCMCLHTYTIKEGKHVQIMCPSTPQAEWRKSMVLRAVMQLQELITDANFEELF